MPFDKLNELSEQKDRIILGLMSGTSVDGLDLAVCRFSDSGINTSYEILNHGTVDYTDEQRDILLNFASAETVNMEKLCIYHAELSHWHASMIRSKLSEWGMAASDIDLIATHGQTIRHAPKRIHKIDGLPNSTFQLGDADHLAYLTGIHTVSDFRQKHVAAGGEGAPLAVYGDQILFNSPGSYRVLVNIGGISNITILDGKGSGDLPVTFDTGPGNTLMDQVVRQRLSPQRIDNGGEIAFSGKIHVGFLKSLKSHEFFSQTPPKTTGPELLSPSFVKKALEESGSSDLPVKDILATLNRFTAETIADSIRTYGNPPASFSVYISGGGVHNRTLMWNLQDCLPEADVMNFDKLGVNADAKEALFFAAMANELVCGNRFPVLGEDGKIRIVRFGRISFPD
ncbi:MAG: anhydro-N-acetylmuramic acid kinase [Balneolales bacterium]|nr:anhydro-N-acetylmuramic acid kinase [Balneolales bacterium]